MTTSFFNNTYESDVPLAGTAGAPISPTGVLSITNNPTTHIDQQIYHFWVTDSLCLESPISHFQHSGFHDGHFTRFSDREGWERSYPNAVLRKDTLPTVGAQTTTTVAPPLISSPHLTLLPSSTAQQPSSSFSTVKFTPSTKSTDY